MSERSTIRYCAVLLAAFFSMLSAKAQAPPREIWRLDPAEIASGSPKAGVPDGEIALQRIGAVGSGRSPVGTALLFDGQGGALRGKPLAGLEPTRDVGLTCWIRIDAYPWNDLPIIDQVDPHGRFFFGLDAYGHLVYAASSGVTFNQFQQSATPVPLRRWILVSLGVRNGLANFTVSGVAVATIARMPPTDPLDREPAIDSRDTSGSLLIAHSRTPRLPGPAKLIHPLIPVDYSLEGELGEVDLYDAPLLPVQIAKIQSHADTSMLAPSAFPAFPQGSLGDGSFGAFYTTLHYDPAWDALRRIAPDSDVVVRFPHSSRQLIFWQGNNYVPAWVTDNGHWYTDEFMEIYGHPRCPDGEDCEPMSDKQSRYSHVRILENTAARVVIHWRYALSEVENYRLGDAEPLRNWGDWADEYWTVYPDGVAVRRSVLWMTAADREKTEFQESIVLVPPGERPEDSLNFDALTFANLDGDTHTYSWQPKTVPGPALPMGPKDFPEPKNPVIQWVNLKSHWKPFEVAWGSPVTLDAYNSEQSISSFEWWNHFPVAQIPSSGRPAFAADRPGHTSISHIYWPIYQQDKMRLEKLLMTGLTDKIASDLVPTAKAWRTPALATLSDGTVVPYDPAQRAYVLSASTSRTFRLKLHATVQTPLVHPALIARGWIAPPTVRVIKGTLTDPVRTGAVQQIDNSYAVIYLPLESTSEVEIEIDEPDDLANAQKKTK